MVAFAGSAKPDLRFLAPHIPLVIWDETDTDQRTTLSVNCSGTDSTAPVLRLKAPLESGAWRCFLAFATPPGTGGKFIVKDAEKTSLLSSDLPYQERDEDTCSSLDLGYVLAGLTDGGRVRVIRFLLHSCRTAFGLSRDAAYTSNMKRLVEQMSLQPGLMEACAFLTRRFVLVSGSIPVSIGNDVQALTISARSVEETPVPPWTDASPRRGAKNRSFLMAVGKSALSKDAYVVLMSATGIAIRQIKTATQSIDPIVTWLLQRKPGSPIYHNYALQCLTNMGQVDPSAASAVHEIFALDQNHSSGFAGQHDLRFSPECAVAAGDKLFLSGWFLDPHELIRAAKIRLGGWSVTLDRKTLATNSAPHTMTDKSAEQRGQYFAVLVCGPGRPPVCGTVQVTLHLKSGAWIEISPLALVHTGKAARQRILGAAASINVTDRQLAEVFAPALKALADGEERRPVLSRDVADIGPRLNYAGASVIVPLVNDTGIMTTWASAIAAGIVDGHRNEFVFVQPTGADLALTERALGNLYSRSGVSSKLVRSVDGASSHDLLNASVSAASCDRLVFFGEGCLPYGENTLITLLSALDEDTGTGLAGGAVLDPNGSIIHGGYMPPRDGWIGSAYAGFPAIELGRIAQRDVFACSSEFFALHRDAFEQIGGFSSKYLTRAWGDADFSRRSCVSGKSVRFEHRARATKFQFTGQVPQIETALAHRIDAWCFAKDWPDETAQCSDEAPAAHRPETVQPHEVPREQSGNAKWAA